MTTATLQVLTANRLTDGAVLYRKADGWALTLPEADVYADKSAAEAALSGTKLAQTPNATAPMAVIHNDFMAIPPAPARHFWLRAS